jgi:hypothetical protein
LVALGTILISGSMGLEIAGQCLLLMCGVGLLIDFETPPPPPRPYQN